MCHTWWVGGLDGLKSSAKQPRKMRAKNTLKIVTRDGKQVTLYKLNKLCLGICMYIHTHTCMQ